MEPAPRSLDGTAFGTGFGNPLLGSRYVWIPVALAILVPGVCIAQDGRSLDWRIASDTAKPDDSYRETDNELETLWSHSMPDAGKARCGAILESRLVRSAGTGSRATDLVVSVKNVGQSQGLTLIINYFPLGGCRAPNSPVK